jgi:hypothetical protein
LGAPVSEATAEAAVLSRLLVRLAHVAPSLDAGVGVDSVAAVELNPTELTAAVRKTVPTIFFNIVLPFVVDN